MSYTTIGYRFTVENLTPEQVSYAKKLWEQITNEETESSSLPVDLQQIDLGDISYPENFISFEDKEIEVIGSEDVFSESEDAMCFFLQHLVKKFNLPPIGYTCGVVDSKGWGSGSYVFITKDDIESVTAEKMLEMRFEEVK